MAGEISTMTETTVPAAANLLEIVQSGVNKKIQYSNLVGTLGQQSAAAVNIDGGSIDGTSIGGASASSAIFTGVTISALASYLSLKTSGGIGADLGVVGRDSSNTIRSQISLGIAQDGTTIFYNDSGGSLAEVFSMAGAFIKLSAATHIASTTQTQGQTPMAVMFNLVATVANNNDAVTLPAAVQGRCVFVLNMGASTLQVFPASGDAIGAGGANNSTTQATLTGKLYIAGDSTTWIVF